MSSSTNSWYKNAVFYQVYPRAFYDSNGDGHGDLRGLIHKLDYLQQLGVDCLWLMPIYPSPLNDGGYDIADFCGVVPEYGSLEDFKELVVAAHARGMRIISDLVLNHTSDQHPWFQAARQDRNSPFRDYYVWSDTDQCYADARIIFLDTQRSNWTWDPLAGQYYWHRFYPSQPDLNYDNPAVRQAMLDVVRFWLELGIDGFRADAVPYLFEREGTNCENLPETHAYLKEIRRFIDENYPGCILLCEANQWPADVRPYFGDGDEFQLGFNFPIMPRLFMAIRKGDREPLVWISRQIPEIPEDCQWCTFLRNHDELTLEMVTEEEREWMWREFAPDPRMRLNLGIRRRLAPLLDGDRRKIELANSLLFSLPGSPVLYYGDEIGMGDNIYLNDRDGVRTPMQWEAGETAGFSSANPERFYLPLITNSVFGPNAVNVTGQVVDPGSLLNTIRRMIALRKCTPSLGWGSFAWVDAGSPAIAAYLRSAEGQRPILVVNNLSAETVWIDRAALPQGEWIDLFSGNCWAGREGSAARLALSPYGYRWLGIAV